MRALVDRARHSPRAWAAAAILVTGIAAGTVAHVSRPAAQRRTALSLPPGVGAPGGPPTSSDGLRTRIADMEQQLRARPGDLGASVLLSDALLRQARASGDSRP